MSSYAREDPKLGGVPFFFWYQFLWVFLTAGLTYTAHRLVLARAAPDRQRRANPDGTAGTPTGRTIDERSLSPLAPAASTGSPWPS